MSEIILENSSQEGITILSNIFIDQYMPRANGEFVKVYIYLLRLLKESRASLDLAKMADTLLCTERDIARALKYWEKEKLMIFHYTSAGKLSGISLTPPKAEQEENAQSSSSPSPRSSQRLTPDRVRELKQNEAIVQLLYIAEQYLGKTLSPSEMQKVLYFYDEMKMSPELIEYLIEYCVSRNHKSMRYIETVAYAWAKEGITTVEMAKEASSRFRKEYYTILKAMGINNRNPVDTEISYMDTWMKDYGFDTDLILEACSRTVIQTGQPSFQYADKILEGWKSKNVHTLSDVRILDAEHKKRKLAKTAQKQPAAQQKTQNRFNNFHQRDYDFDEYEKRLLNQ
ncbi:MAG: DnaD domain protein [Blautia sp.]